jgi:hypothetical protein
MQVVAAEEAVIQVELAVLVVAVKVNRIPLTQPQVLRI